VTQLDSGELEPTPERRRVTARQVVEWSARTTAGIVTAAIAAGVAFGSLFFVPPTWSVTAPSVEVTPVPAGVTLVCSGSVLRLADDTGEGASQATAIGEPTIVLSVEDADTALIGTSDAGTGDTAQAPTIVTIPPGDATGVAGGLTVQQLSTGSTSGLVAAPCTTPNLRSWIVGGATTLGRTSILTLTNPTEVDSVVDLRLYGETGPVDAPGLEGILVQANTQRVIPVNGLAVDLVAPVIQISAQGGAVAATLQQSIVRGLETGGAELVPAQEPATDLVMTGIRVESQASLQVMTKGRVDEDDVVPMLRLFTTAEERTEAVVSVVPLGYTVADAAAGDTDDGDSHDGHDHGEIVEGQPDPRQLRVTLIPGAVSEIPLTGLAAGEYSIFASADAPIVGAVRSATVATRLAPAPPAPDPAQPAQPQPPVADNDPSSSGPVDAPAGAPSAPGPSLPSIPIADYVVEFAWYSPAARLGQTAASAVPRAFTSTLAVANPGGAEREVSLGDGATLVVPAGGWTTIEVAAGPLILSGADGLSAAITIHDEGLIAQAALQPPPQLARPVTVYP